MLQLQKSQTSTNPKRLLIVSEGSRQNEITGLVNCLRQEPGGSNIRCVSVERKDDTIPIFSLENAFYKEQLEKNLVMNLFQNGTWGSYRYLRRKDGVPVKHDTETEELFSGGVHAKSMIPAFQKKKPNEQVPLLEEYKFVPYKGSVKPSEDQSKMYKEYVAVCSSLSKRLLSGSRQWNKLPQNEKEEILKSMDALKMSDALMKNYLETEANGHVLLHCLSTIINETNELQLEQNAKYKVTDYIKELQNDLLYQTLLQEPCLKTTTDIILENILSNKMKIVEIAEGRSAVCSKIHEYISMSATLDLSYTILRSNTEPLNNNLLPANAHVTPWERKSSIEIRDADLFILNNLNCSAAESKSVLKNAEACLKDEGFILLLVKNRLIPPEVILATVSGISIPCIEESCVEELFSEMNLNVIRKKVDSITSTLYLLRKSKKVSFDDSIIHITAGEYAQCVDKIRDKMLQLQKSQTSTNPKRLLIVSEGSYQSGVIGLVNCLLQEPGASIVRCVFIDSKARTIPKFSLEIAFYKEQLEKNLVMNLFHNGSWGSYRYLRCKDVLAPATTVSEHAYLNTLSTGDLSSLAWINFSKKEITPEDNEICTVYYAGLNMRDIMIASGEVPLAAIPGSSGFKDSALGIEFSGRTSDGRRVMGIVSHKALATSVITNQGLVWDVPDEWSLEQASTVPVAYATAYHALISRGRLEKDERVLIHSGCGVVGQAAIAIALSMGCDVYTTASTQETKEFLKNKFPQIPEEHIFSSEDIFFEQHIMHATKRKGVNVILNSLKEDKLLASLNCLAVNGRFLELSSYDLAKNNNIGMSIFLKNASFDSILMDKLFDCNDKNLEAREEVFQLVKKGIAEGVVTPINTTVFSYDEAEQAFRYLANRGETETRKVVLKIREEEKEKKIIPSLVQVRAIVKTTFEPQKSYIIFEGLGGLEFELIQWLVDRGAKNIVLISRSGTTTGCQKLCLQRCEKASVKVVTSNTNAVKPEEATAIIKLATKLGPVGGIFNLALVLRDGLVEQQSIENCRDVCDCGIETTKNMDLLTREYCPELDWFVCFSSIASGRGKAGQSKYGYANSVMERICEDRVSKGLPGLAIQWGAIENLEIEQDTLRSDVSGPVPQKISSCLEVLDQFLQQDKPVVCSFIPHRPASKIQAI